MRRKNPLCDEEILSLPDCASLTEKGSCTRLAIPRCIGAKCTFLNKPRQSAADDGWKKRLSALPEETQLKISRKYYGGAMPWKL